MKSPEARKYRVPLIYAFVCAALGYLIAHPVAMLIYTFMHQYEREMLQLQREISHGAAQSTYQPVMLPTVLLFLFAGALVGLLLGVAADRRRRRREEEERRKVAAETLHQLTVTLSHYLLNANTIIGGMARHMKRIEPGSEVARSLSVVEDQAKRIEAVLRILSKITEIKTCAYMAQGETRIIDIADEVEVTSEEWRSSPIGFAQSRVKSCRERVFPGYLKSFMV
jgi:signal transduction histidine kinase